MKKRNKFMAGTAVVLAAGLGTGIAAGVGSGTASAGSGEDASTDAAEDSRNDSEQPIQAGPDRDRASEVALRHVGEGRVTETEVEDEESYYEVEVTRDNGSQVDVQLDRDFNVVGSESDGAGEDG